MTRARTATGRSARRPGRRAGPARASSTSTSSASPRVAPARRGPPPGATAGPRTQVSRCVSRFYYERDARGTVAADVTLCVEINQ